ncbi:C13 family peptidase [Phenylobacterium sp.]|uniref:C13 family peptidase n=1 Tax=Phenylobacterium sp. TaxID=1871053 RepID=UPI0025DCAAC4|nr:C13 family peptidase [Phenylobacterium sp.]MCA3721203.1 peptidase C13 [Phenylobacterium sp.]
MLARALQVLLVVALLQGWAAGAAAESPFRSWAALVVAGDWKGSGGGPTEAFDNARRDVAGELVRLGFDPGNILQFSVRPERYKPERPEKSDIRAIFDSMTRLTARAPDGCLVYLTSHGLPQGVIVDEAILAPGLLSAILDRTCGARPTIAVISACYSGVFVPGLGAANRMVLTAARPDRTSFGCGESNRYPFFDECFLQSTGSARDFPSLAGLVRTCVAEREVREGVRPPSEPQVYIGPQLRPILPLYVFPARTP